MIELTYTSILVYNVKSLKIDCQDYKKSTSGCKFCIYDLPCKCSLLSENLVFTPKLVDCQKHIKNVSYPVNLVNLALLQEFFNESRLISALGDTLYPGLIEYQIPLNILYHSFNSIITPSK